MTGNSVRNRLTILLLVYWGCLVNLGPSVHTHEVFGLHGDSCCAVTHQTTPSCCCEHETAHLSDIGQPLELRSEHDCQFCEFFKYLNISSIATPAWIPQEPVELVTTSHQRLLSYHQIPGRARGPPSASQG